MKMVKREDLKPGDGDPDPDKVSHQGLKKYHFTKNLRLHNVSIHIKF